MKSVKLTLSAALLGLALGGCGTDNKGNNPISDNLRGSGVAPTATTGAPEALVRTNVLINEDLAHQLGLDLKNNCVTAVGDLAKNATVEFGGHACEADAKKGEKTFTLTTELAAVKGGPAQQGKPDQGKPDQGKPDQGKPGPDLTPRLYYLVLSTTRRTPVTEQAPEQGKPTQQAPAPTQKPDQGKPVVPPAPPVVPPAPGKPVVPPTPGKPDQGKPTQQGEQGKPAPKFREVTVTARVGEIVVTPYVHVIPVPEQGKPQQQAPTQKPDQGKPVVPPAPTQKPDQGKPVVPTPPAPTQKPDQGKPVVPAPDQKPDQGKPTQPGTQQGEQGQAAAPKTEVLERVELTKLCTAGSSGASYSAVCDVVVKDGRFQGITLKDGQGEEVKGSEKIVEDKPVATPDQGKPQQQAQAPAPAQKPDQGKPTGPVQTQPEQGKVTVPAQTQKPEQGTGPGPKQAGQPKQEQRSSQQGPKAA